MYTVYHNVYHNIVRTGFDEGYALAMQDAMEEAFSACSFFSSLVTSSSAYTHTHTHDAAAMCSLPAHAHAHAHAHPYAHCLSPPNFAQPLLGASPVDIQDGTIPLEDEDYSDEEEEEDEEEREEEDNKADKAEIDESSELELVDEEEEEEEEDTSARAARCLPLLSQACMAAGGGDDALRDTGDGRQVGTSRALYGDESAPAPPGSRLPVSNVSSIVMACSRLGVELTFEKIVTMQRAGGSCGRLADGG